MNAFLSKKAQGIAPYVAGEQPKDKKYVKLNTNENPYPPSPKAVQALRAFEADSLKLYPAGATRVSPSVFPHFSMRTERARYLRT